MAKKEEQAGSTHQFGSAFGLVKPSFELFKRNLWTYVFLSLAPVLLIIGASTFIFRFKTPVHFDNAGNIQDFSELWTAGNIVSLLAGLTITAVVGLVFYTALQYATLAAAHNKAARISAALKAGLKFTWRLFLLELMAGLAVLLGLVALIVPGIILIVKWTPRLAIAPFVMFEQDLGPIETFKRSGELAKGAGLWGVIGVLILISLGISIATGILSSLLPEGDLQLIAALLENVAYLAVISIPALRYVQIRKAHHSKSAS